MFGSDSANLADLLFDAEPTAGEWCDLEQGSIISLHSAAASRNVYLPCHYEPYYRYPLVLWLESRPGELRNWFPAISERNYLAVGVQGPLAARTVLGGSSWPRDRSAIAAATEAIHAAIQQVTGEFSIHPERVFLAGLHDTAALALTVGLTHPQEFAGVAAIDPGAVPLMLLLREFRRMKARRVFVGVSERKNSYRPIEELADLLETAGAELATYNACTAENPQPLAQRLDAWMIQTICEAQQRAA
jgi:predicted esterase